MLSSEKSPLLVQSSNSKPSRQDLNATNRSLGSNKNEFKPSNTNTNIANATVIALAFTVFVQSYLLEGVFPYAGFLTLHLLSSENIDSNDRSNVNEETVGKYAGYVACSFMAGRTITAVYWGRLADTYGRVFVLEVSLVASAITSIGFGFASTYTEALLWRSFMGVGNGITGTIKCLLSEIKESAGSQAKETKTMAIVYGMRGYGFLLCPAITGFLSDPMKQYPQLMGRMPLWVQSLLLAYPFVLPNLVASVLCLGAVRLVREFVEETLPEERCRSFVLDLRSIVNWRKKNTGEAQSANPNSIRVDGILGNPTPATTSSSTTADLLWTSSDDFQRIQSSKLRSRWFHLYVYWIFSFLNIAADELFPLFCLSKLSGLGLQEKQISSILGGTTIVYGLLQYFLLTGMVHKLGLYPTLRIGIFFCVPPSLLIPFGSLWLAGGMTNGSNGSIENNNDLTVWMVLYLCIIIAALKSFSSVAFSTITMATNRTVDTIDQRATLNGIASLGGSFAKACGPVFAGTLFSFLAGSATTISSTISSSGSSSGEGSTATAAVIEPPYGSIVAYGILSAMGLVLGVQTLCLQGSP